MSHKIEAVTTRSAQLLVAPHGGVLVQRIATPAEAAEAKAIPCLVVDADTLADAEQIALGVYSPFIGFMDREALCAVLAEHRLPDCTT